MTMVQVFPNHFYLAQFQRIPRRLGWKYLQVMIYVLVFRSSEALFELLGHRSCAIFGQGWPPTVSHIHWLRGNSLQCSVP